MIWFLNPFINIYGERLKIYNIDKDFIILLKPYYEDVNDYDFYLSLIKMKLTFNIQITIINNSRFNIIYFIIFINK